MEQSKVLYEIAYDKTRQLVNVYPKWRGPRPNHQIIGDFTPKNPRANLEDYIQELGEEITAALARVGEPSYEPFRITVVPLDGTKEVMVKDIRGVLERVALKDQVPVSADTTVAMATEEERENGELKEIPTQATKEIVQKELSDAREARLEKETEADEKPVKKATKKATTK